MFRLISLLALVFSLGAALPRVAVEDEETSLTPYHKPKLPAEWLGRWEGTLRRASLDLQPAFDIPLTLDVRAVAKSDDRRFELTFGGAAPAQRKYLMRPDESDPDRFILDEGTGVLIDVLLKDGVLLSMYDLGGNLVSTRFALDGDAIEVEMVGYSTQNARVTKGPYEVKSFAAHSLQRGRLQRRAAEDDESGGP